MIWYVALEGKTGYTEEYPTFLGERKVVKKTKTIRVEVTEQQYEAFKNLLEGKENKSAWVRALLARGYEEELGKPFPPDPIMGTPKRREKASE